MVFECLCAPECPPQYVLDHKHLGVFLRGRDAQGLLIRHNTLVTYAISRHRPPVEADTFRFLFYTYFSVALWDLTQNHISDVESLAML